MMQSKLSKIDNRDNQSDPSNSKREYGKEEKYEYISPFRLPSDDEVFVYREAEREKKQELKRLANDLRVWEKKTGTSRQPLRLFKHTELPPIKEKGNKGYGQKDKTLILEAQRIINDRRKQRETQGKSKEGTVELLDQKKEMFLVEMTVGIIENERKILIDKENEKREALKKSEEMLEKDRADFQAYLQANEAEKKRAIQAQEDEIDERKRKEFEFKRKKNEETSLKTEEIKNKELIEKYLHDKKFLDKLGGKEFLERQAKDIEEFIENFKRDWIERELEEQNSIISDSTVTRGGRTNPGAQMGRTNVGFGKKLSKTQLEDRYYKLVEQGEIDEVDDFVLNYEMPFKDPGQLIEYFNDLEEQNLRLIQMMSEAEQSLETLKNNYNNKKKDLNSKSQTLKENKNALIRKKQEKEMQIKYLESRLSDNKVQKKDEIKPLRKQIITVFNEFKSQMNVNQDIDTVSTLTLLGSIEALLDKQLNTMKQHPVSLVAEKKKACEAQRKKDQRLFNQEQEKARQEEKSRLAQEQFNQPSKKRQGRIDMGKSEPLVKNNKKEEVTVDNNEEEENKYFNLHFIS